MTIVDNTLFGSGTYKSRRATRKRSPRRSSRRPTSRRRPLRLALGSDAYGAMHRALSERLAELEGQKDLAASTDEQ
jgi:hypothetical protein